MHARCVCDLDIGDLLQENGNIVMWLRTNSPLSMASVRIKLLTLHPDHFLKEKKFTGVKWEKQNVPAPQHTKGPSHFIY